MPQNAKGTNSERLLLYSFSIFRAASSNASFDIGSKYVSLPLLLLEP